MTATILVRKRQIPDSKRSRIHKSLLPHWPAANSDDLRRGIVVRRVVKPEIRPFAGEPVLVIFHQQHADQSQAGAREREDPHPARATPYLQIQAAPTDQFHRSARGAAAEVRVTQR